MYTVIMLAMIAPIYNETINIEKVMPTTCNANAAYTNNALRLEFMPAA